VPLKKLYTFVSHFLKRVGLNSQAKEKERPKKHEDALITTLWQEKHPLHVLFYSYAVGSGRFLELPPKGLDIIKMPYIFISVSYNLVRRCDMEGREDFFPKGAVAFFVLMIAFYAFVWLSIYFTLLARR
jgi:hypothetical protein